MESKSKANSDKSIGMKVLVFFEVTMTSISFMVVFVTFMISIISRYFLRTAVSWTYEVSILGYMWTMFFGVGRALRNDEHVVFSLVYDKLSPKGERVCLIMYNIMLAGLLSIVFIPCVQAMLGSNSKTGVLGLPYKVAFSPFFFMFAEIIIISILNVIKAVKLKPGETMTKSTEEEVQA